MLDLSKLFSPAEIAANWTEIASNRIPYLGEGLFPAKKKTGLDLRWIKGSKGAPISLMPSAFDAKATFRDRIGVSAIETEMPFFREGFKIKERDRQEILRATESNDPYVEAVLARMFDDANELIEAANVVAERERMGLLFHGDIAFKANGVDYSYNYGLQNVTILSGTSLWTAPTTADPIKDIKTVADTIRSNTGSEIAVAIMNSYTFGLLAATDAIKNRFLTTTGRSFSYLTDAEVKAVVADTLGVQIVIYDKVYRDEDKVAHKFVPDGRVSLIPAGPLGNTWYGTTPEEADLYGNPAASVAIVNTGVAITRIVDTHPVNLNTFASEIVLPSFERIDEVGILVVVSE